MSAWFTLTQLHWNHLTDAGKGKLRPGGQMLPTNFSIWPTGRDYISSKKYKQIKALSFLHVSSWVISGVNSDEMKNRTLVKVRFFTRLHSPDLQVPCWDYWVVQGYNQYSCQYSNILNTLSLPTLQCHQQCHLLIHWMSFLIWMNILSLSALFHILVIKAVLVFVQSRDLKFYEIIVIMYWPCYNLAALHNTAFIPTSGASTADGLWLVIDGDVPGTADGACVCVWW